MDGSEMQELLRGYLNEMDWGAGVTKDDLMAHLAGRDDALRTMLNEYVAEGAYQSADEAMTLVPEQAWQDVQGDRWRGAESQYVEDVESNFQDGPVGQAESDTHRVGTRGAAKREGGGDATGDGGRADIAATSGAAGEAGAGEVLVDAMVIGVDVTGDGVTDVEIVDTIVVETGGDESAAGGTGRCV